MNLLPNNLFPIHNAPTPSHYGPDIPKEGGSKAAARFSRPKQIMLPNGLRIIYEKSPSPLPLTSLHCFVHLGSANEFDGARGVSHILEHMCFKGTKRLPRAVDVSRIFDETGAYMNAYTEKQVTCYVVKCENQYADTCIHVLSDMIFNSVFDRREFNREYEVVIEESKRFADDAFGDLEENMARIIYKGSSFEYSVDSLEYHKKLRVSYETMVAFYKTYYHPQNVVLSIVSPLDFAHILRVVKKSYFSGAMSPTGSIYRAPILTLAAYRDGPQFCFQKKADMESTLVGIGFRTCNTYCEDKYALNLLKFVLVGPISSYFFKKLRNENGLTYRTYININHFEHVGDFSIFTQVTREKLLRNNGAPGLLPIMFGILRDLVRNGITKKDYETAKGYMRGIIVRNLADNDNLANHNGMHVLFHSTEDAFSYGEKYKLHYEKVTRKEINDVLRKYFTRENMFVTIVGSIAASGADNKLKREIEKLAL